MGFEVVQNYKTVEASALEGLRAVLDCEMECRAHMLSVAPSLFSPMFPVWCAKALCSRYHPDKAGSETLEEHGSRQRTLEMMAHDCFIGSFGSYECHNL